MVGFLAVISFLAFISFAVFGVICLVRTMRKKPKGKSVKGLVSSLAISVAGLISIAVLSPPVEPHSISDGEVAGQVIEQSGGELAELSEPAPTIENVEYIGYADYVDYVDYTEYSDEPLMYIYADLDVYYSPDDESYIIALYNYSLAHAVVARVIDGDTIELADGERVRLIGVDAPEMGFFGGVYEPGATEATEFVRSLVYGETVWLEPDGNDLDGFGRLRRYVWLRYPADAQYEGYILRYQLNALLLINGHAEVMIIGSPRNEALFRQIALPAPEPLTYAYQADNQQAPVMVWLSATGTRWHSINNCGTMNPNRARQVTLEYARAQPGFAPCNNCDPPR